jgi:hypothetical protein
MFQIEIHQGKDTLKNAKTDVVLNNLGAFRWHRLHVQKKCCDTLSASFCIAEGAQKTQGHTADKMATPLIPIVALNGFFHDSPKQHLLLMRSFLKIQTEKWLNPNNRWALYILK